MSEGTADEVTGIVKSTHIRVALLQVSGDCLVRRRLCPLEEKSIWKQKLSIKISPKCAQIASEVPLCITTMS